MDLYDPDRAKELSYVSEVRTWEAFQIAWNSATVPIRQIQARREGKRGEA
jgi:hypothetical protein